MIVYSLYSTGKYENLSIITDGVFETYPINSNVQGVCIYPKLNYKTGTSLHQKSEPSGEEFREGYFSRFTDI